MSIFSFISDLFKSKEVKRLEEDVRSQLYKPFLPYFYSSSISATIENGKIVEKQKIVNGLEVECTDDEIYKMFGVEDSPWDDLMKWEEVTCCDEKDCGCKRKLTKKDFLKKASKVKDPEWEEVEITREF